MSLEREHILEALKARLETIEGVVRVTRNLRWNFNASSLPAIKIVDRGDRVAKHSTRPPVKIEKVMLVGVGVMIQGSTEDLAPTEMSTFMAALKSAVYATNQVIGTEYRGWIVEKETSGLTFEPIGDRTVLQGIDFEITYSEDVGNY